MRIYTERGAYGSGKGAPVGLRFVDYYGFHVRNVAG